MPKTHFAYLRQKAKPNGKISGFVGDHHVYVDLRVSAASERDERVGVTAIRRVDMTPYLPEFEQVGRFTLSAFLGTRSVAKPSTAFAGTLLATRESAYSDTRFVRLESAAKAAGWSMAKGEHNITAQLTKAGRPTLIFVAAAPSFKKGPTWTDLPDVPLIVDDELWVPTTALASL